MKHHLIYIFVYGLSGCGSYDRQCDRMALQGGLTHKSEVLPYYLKALEMTEALKERGEGE